MQIDKKAFEDMLTALDGLFKNAGMKCLLYGTLPKTTVNQPSWIHLHDCEVNGGLFCEVMKLRCCLDPLSGSNEGSHLS
jgi:hypothetical protein